MNSVSSFALTAALSLSLGSLSSGCKKAEEAPPVTETGADKAAADKAAADKAAADKAAAEAQRVADALKKLEDDTAKEKERWATAKLEEKGAALVAKKFKNTKDALTAILASEHRTPGDADRDPARHPLETLTFFGIEPSMTVVEVGSGGGWYTELLAPLLAREGKLVVMGADPNGPADQMSTVYGKRLQAFLDKSPAMYGKIQHVIVDPPTSLELGPEGSADLAVAIREIHGWQRRGQFDAYLAAIHKVLKDGGTFGVVAHRAKDGAKPEDTVEKGYLAQDWVIQNVEAAGFKLVDKSEINANPKDTKDYEKGVWTLPPNFREGDKDREKYAAIGESDRMTLKFTKVAAPAAGQEATATPPAAAEPATTK